MNTISVSYNLIWMLKDYPHLQITKCKKIFNTKTGRRIKITLNGGSIGLWVSPKKFIVKSELNKHIELIPKKQDCPF
jgi:hypothetical protein